MGKRERAEKETDKRSDIEQISVLGNWDSNPLEKCGRKLFQNVGYILFRYGKIDRSDELPLKR